MTLLIDFPDNSCIIKYIDEIGNVFQYCIDDIQCLADNYFNKDTVKCKNTLTKHGLLSEIGQKYFFEIKNPSIRFNLECSSLVEKQKKIDINQEIEKKLNTFEKNMYTNLTNIKNDLVREIKNNFSSFKDEIGENIINVMQLEIDSVKENILYQNDIVKEMLKDFEKFKEEQNKKIDDLLKKHQEIIDIEKAILQIAQNQFELLVKTNDKIEKLR